MYVEKKGYVCTPTRDDGASLRGGGWVDDWVAGCKTVCSGM